MSHKISISISHAQSNFFPIRWSIMHMLTNNYNSFLFVSFQRRWRIPYAWGAAKQGPASAVRLRQNTWSSSTFGVAKIVVTSRRNLSLLLRWRWRHWCSSSWCARGRHGWRETNMFAGCESDDGVAGHKAQGQVSVTSLISRWRHQQFYVRNV